MTDTYSQSRYVKFCFQSESLMIKCEIAITAAWRMGVYRVSVLKYAVLKREDAESVIYQ